MTDMIRVVIADDHDVVRRGLAMFLGEFNDLVLIGEAASGAQVLKLCAETQPNVVLLDMTLPDMDGVAITQAIRTQNPDIQVVILTGSHDGHLVQAALRAGAMGYLHKNVSVIDMANAIRLAHVKKPTLSPEATQSLINLAAPSTPAQNYNLTERESTILKLIVEGMNNQEIADRLFVSRATVKATVSTILSKLGVQNRIDAVRLALQESLFK